MQYSILSAEILRHVSVDLSGFLLGNSSEAKYSIGSVGFYSGLQVQ